MDFKPDVLVQYCIDSGLIVRGEDGLYSVDKGKFAAMEFALRFCEKLMGLDDEEIKNGGNPDV